jgi:hypothetical protein
MKLKDEFNAELTRTKSIKIDSLLEKLSKEDREYLISVLMNPEIPTRLIERVLRKKNIQCGKSAILNWRRSNGVKIIKNTMMGE